MLGLTEDRKVGSISARGRRGGREEGGKREGASEGREERGWWEEGRRVRGGGRE